MIDLFLIRFKIMRLLSPRYICCCYVLFYMLFLLPNTEIGSISTTSISDSYNDSNTTLWHNLYRHKSIDCNNLYWLHPAKTSSSFIIPLQHICCSELFENITSGVTTEMLEEYRSKQANNNKSYHTSSFRYTSYGRLETIERDGYPSLREHCNYSFIHRSTRHDALPTTKNLHLINAVTMLREPKARMISAFLYGIHNAGFETNMTAYGQLRRTIKEIALNSSLTKNEQLLQQAQMYASSPFMYGYQLRLIIGSLNADLSKVDDDDDVHMPLVHRAIHRLRDFFFVGIFEEYNKSIQVLHALSKVNTTPTIVENFHFTHSTDHEQAAYLHEHVVFNDRYDNFVYEAAKKIFMEEIEFIQSTV